MSSTENRQRPRYGNWVRPRSAGFFGMTFGTSMLALGAFIFSIIMLMISFTAGVTTAVLSLVVLAPLVISIGGRSGYERGLVLMGWLGRKRRKEHIYRSGPFSKVPGGTHRLPGVLAATQMYEAKDAWGNSYGLIRMEKTGEYTIVLRCSPQGDEAIEADTIDQQVAQWGHYLAELGQPGDISAAVVVVETMPETGQRLRFEQAGLTRQDAHPLAKAILAESGEMSVGSWQLSARLAITFKATTADRRQNASEMAVEIGGRLPELYEGLDVCGVAASPMTATEIAALTRRSYDPAVQDDVERLLYTHDAPNLFTWHNCGPSSAEEGWDTYQHDSGHSHTTAMEQAPRGNATTETVLKRLLSGHWELPRKRVAIIYRPHTPGDAANIVDNDYKDALVALNSGKGLQSAAALLKERSTAQARDDEAQGHGLVRFAMLVTVTSEEPLDMRRKRSVLRSVSDNARIATRPCYGYQAAAFAASLGIGVILPEHYSLPRSLAG